MFEIFAIGQKVVTVTDTQQHADGVIVASASDDQGNSAYKVSYEAGSTNTPARWFKAVDVFVEHVALPEQD
jgi:hypothetical protein